MNVYGRHLLRGRRIVLVDIMDTLLSPSLTGDAYDVRDGAADFFYWCNSRDILVGIHSDIPSVRSRHLLEKFSLGRADYVWGTEYVNVPIEISGRTTSVKNFSRMLHEARCSRRDALIISDGDIEAAGIAGVERLGVPNFGMEEITGEKFDFRYLLRE